MLELGELELQTSLSGRAELIFAEPRNIEWLGMTRCAEPCSPSGQPRSQKGSDQKSCHERGQLLSSASRPKDAVNITKRRGKSLQKKNLTRSTEVVVNSASSFMHRSSLEKLLPEWRTNYRGGCSDRLQPPSWPDFGPISSDAATDGAENGGMVGQVHCRKPAITCQKFLQVSWFVF